MKVVCLQENLAQALAVIRQVAPRNSIIPIMSHVVLSVNGGSHLRLSATNLEFGASIWVGGRVEESGTIAVPAQTITDLVKTYPADGTVRMQVTSKGTLRITCNRHRSNIKGVTTDLDLERFAIPEVGEEEGYKVDAEQLCSAINRVAFAAAPPDTARPILTGVHIHLRGDRLVLEAADGYRLSTSSVPLEQVVGEELEAIVPATAMRFLPALCKQEEEQVTISLWKPPSSDGILSPTRLVFRLNRAVLASQLISGDYPDFERIFPSEEEGTHIVADTVDLLQAVRMAGVFAKHHPLAPISLVVDQGRLTISGESVEAGDASAPVPASIEGEDVTIKIGYKYLLNALTAIDTEKTTLQINGANRPFVIRHGSENAHVIMPVL